MKLAKVLKESLALLRRQPKIFIPNIGVSLLYGAYEIALIKLGLDMFSVQQADSGAYLAANGPLILAVFSFYPVIGVLDLVTYSMYPSFVADYRAGRGIGLVRGLRSALGAWRIWMSLGLVILGSILVMSSITSVFFGLSYVSGNQAFLVIGMLLVLMATAFLALSVYFVIPVGVIEKEKTLSCYRRSLLFSIRHKAEVLPMLAFSIAMALFAAYMVSMLSAGVGGGAAFLGLGLFFFAKVIQSAAYTYISVVNPYLYTELR